MPKFDYSTSAELFPSRRYAKSLSRYRRFTTGAEAIRYAVEDMPKGWLIGTMLVVDEGRYEGAAIKALYDAEGFPLERALAEA